MVPTVVLIGFGVLGLLLGSFANAVALRYNPDRFMFAPATGRSACPHCRRTLTALELIPVVSWVVLRGKCYECHAPISWRYPAVELAMALSLIAVPFGLHAIGAGFLEPWRYALVAACWIVILTFLMMITLIDLKYYLIPDEASAVIAGVGGIAAWASAPTFTAASGSFLGSYAMLAGLHDQWIVGHVLGAVVSGGLLLALYLITKGRGIGFGDVKLAGALGIAFAWPDSLVLVGLGFILGTLAALPGVLMRRVGMKTALPFGPFLALAAVVIIGLGAWGAEAYFSLLLL